MLGQSTRREECRAGEPVRLHSHLNGDWVTVPTEMRGMWLWNDGLREPGEVMIVWCQTVEAAPFLAAEWRGYPVQVRRRRAGEGDIRDVVAPVESDVVVSNNSMPPLKLRPRA